MSQEEQKLPRQVYIDGDSSEPTLDLLNEKGVENGKLMTIIPGALSLRGRFHCSDGRISYLYIFDFEQWKRKSQWNGLDDWSSISKSDSPKMDSVEGAAAC